MAALRIVLFFQMDAFSKHYWPVLIGYIVEKLKCFVDVRVYRLWFLGKFQIAFENEGQSVCWNELEVLR